MKLNSDIATPQSTLWKTGTVYAFTHPGTPQPFNGYDIADANGNVTGGTTIAPDSTDCSLKKKRRTPQSLTSSVQLSSTEI